VQFEAAMEEKMARKSDTTNGQKGKRRSKRKRFDQGAVTMAALKALEAAAAK
jgi:hypothetical protein